MNYLRNTQPEKFIHSAEKKLIRHVRRIRKFSGAYKNILHEHNIESSDIKTIQDFKQYLPVTDKLNYFEKYSYEQLLGRNESRMKNAMSSSGYTGTFAYGFTDENIAKRSRLGVDTTFDYWFSISDKKTFLINCAPMGVHVETSLPLAETSVRSDMAISLLKKVSPAFDQTIIGGDPYFLKKLIEEGDEAGINWEQLQVSLITAQDWLPESLRSYMASRIGIDPESEGERGIYATMGMTELGLNVFHESKYTVKIRRALLRDPELRNAFKLSGSTLAPCFFHYYPFRTYIESVTNAGIDELLFTVTDPKSLLPIIRYSTGDSGIVLTYNQLKKILHPAYQQLLPDLKLPLGILFGRSKNRLNKENHVIHMEDIKEGLFNDPEVAQNITGLIKVLNEENEITVLIHLERGIKNSDSLRNKIVKAAHNYLSTELNVLVKSYNDFPSALELNYEKKLGS